MNTYIMLMECCDRFDSSLDRVDITGETPEKAFRAYIENNVRRYDPELSDAYAWVEKKDLGGRKVYKTEKGWTEDYKRCSVYKVKKTDKEIAEDEKEVKSIINQYYKLKYDKKNRFYVCYGDDETNYTVIVP